jgi:hypothetical protein
MFVRVRSQAGAATTATLLPRVDAAPSRRTVPARGWDRGAECHELCGELCAARARLRRETWLRRRPVKLVRNALIERLGRVTVEDFNRALSAVRLT